MKTAEKLITFKSKDETYIVNFSINAMCEVERKFDGKGFPAILADLSDPEAITMGKMRFLFWGALIDHRPEITPSEAGELIMAAGGLGGALELVTQAIVASGMAEAKPASRTKS